MDLSVPLFTAEPNFLMSIFFFLNKKKNFSIKTKN